MSTQRRLAAAEATLRTGEPQLTPQQQMLLAETKALVAANPSLSLREAFLQIFNKHF